MSDCISLYRILNSSTSNDVFDIQPYSLKYIDEDNQSCPLGLESDSIRHNLYFIKDPDSIWTHDDYGFIIQSKIVINDPSSLFGPGSNTVACADATLGLAFQWSSKMSSRKSTRKIGSFKQCDRDLNFTIIEQFGRCQFREQVNFSIILYLETPGSPQEDEDLFINQQGYLLGELNPITIQIDGNGSMLPVFYEDVRGAALWRVNCNFVDPSVDSFSDSDIVSITINRSNPNFKYIDKKNEAYNPQMANEVMSAAISMIIESFRAIDPNFNSLKDPENGSISDAVRYFKDVLSWDLSTPITINKSIREAFENKKD